LTSSVTLATTGGRLALGEGEGVFTLVGLSCAWAAGTAAAVADAAPALSRSRRDILMSPKSSMGGILVLWTFGQGKPE
jgi:L-serine deaminase